MHQAAVDPRIRKLVEQVLMQSPVARTLGIRLDVLERDHVELLLPFSPGNITVGEMVHGGVIATLLDVAGAAASASAADADTMKGGATGNLSIQYLAPANGVTLRAVADVVKRGKRQVVCDVSAYAERPEEGVLVAKALMSWTIL